MHGTTIFSMSHQEQQVIQYTQFSTIYESMKAEFRPFYQQKSHIALIITQDNITLRV